MQDGKLRKERWRVKRPIADKNSFESYSPKLQQHLTQLISGVTYLYEAPTTFANKASQSRYKRFCFIGHITPMIVHLNLYLR